MNAYDTIFSTVEAIASKCDIDDPESDFDPMLEALDDALGGSGEVVVGSWRSGDFETGGRFYMQFAHKVLPLYEYQIDGYGVKRRVHRTHYAMQLCRIPSEKQCTLRNVLHLAVYMGLFLSGLRVGHMPSGVVTMFRDMRMDKLVYYLADVESFARAAAVYNPLVQEAVNNMRDVA